MKSIIALVLRSGKMLLGKRFRGALELGDGDSVTSTPTLDLVTPLAASLVIVKGLE